MEKMVSNAGKREENVKQIAIMRENFRFLRQSNNWSIEELANFSGINKKILTKIENGEDFDVRYLIKLCHIYHIKPHEIFFRIN